MSGLTQTGTLPVGIEVAGVLHRTYTLRPARVIDNINAIDEVGSHNHVAVSAAVFARQLTQLGTLKAEEIDYGLVCEMDPRDFNELEAASTALAKKALPAPDLTGTGTAPGLALSGSGSAGTTAES